MTSPPTPEAVIFDFDGTIADSEPVHERSIRQVIEPLGWSVGSDDFRERYIGTSDRYCFQALAVEHGETADEARLDRLVEAKRHVYLGLLDAGAVRAFDGALELMRIAAGRVRIAVCSGSRTATIEPTLDRFGVLGLLGALVGADQVANAKPAPDGYRLTCERLGVAPESCVAVEDTDHGIASATGAGVRCIAVAHTCGPERLSGADRVYDTIGQIGLDELLGG